MDTLRVETQGQMGYYVYRLVDPAGQTVYVGKGCGDRVHAHRGRSDLPAVYEERIVRWGLTEAEAFLVESALIAVCDPPANRVSGHGDADTDLGVDELNARLGAAPFPVSDLPDGIFFVKIRGGKGPSYEQLVREGGSALLDRVRGDWTCNAATAKRTRLLAAVTPGGVVRRVFVVSHPVPVTVSAAGHTYLTPKGKVQTRWRWTQVTEGDHAIVGRRLVDETGADPTANQTPFTMSWTLRREATVPPQKLAVAS